MLVFLITKMAVVTSRANQQYCNNQIKVTETKICGGTRRWFQTSTIDEDLILTSFNHLKSYNQLLIYF